MSEVRIIPKPAPPSTDTLARIAALERDLAATQHALYVERALRAYPAVEPVIDLITATDEEHILAQAARLASPRR